MAGLDLPALLRSPPEGIEVRTEGSCVTLVLNVSGEAPRSVVPATRGYRRPVTTLAIVMGWMTGWIALVAVTFSMTPETIGVGLVPVWMALFVAPIIWLLRRDKPREIEIELLPGTLRIGDWRTSMRDLKEIAYVPLGDLETGPNHALEFVAEDGIRRVFPDAGQPAAQWLGRLLKAFHQRALEDTAQPPRRLVELVDEGQSP